MSTCLPLHLSLSHEGLYHKAAQSAIPCFSPRSTCQCCSSQSSGTSYFELLQVAVVLGAVEEEPGLPLRALDEAVRGQQLLDDAGLAQRCRSTIGVPVVSIVVEQVWIKAHLGTRSTGSEQC